MSSSHRQPVRARRGGVGISGYVKIRKREARDSSHMRSCQLSGLRRADSCAVSPRAVRRTVVTALFRICTPLPIPGTFVLQIARDRFVDCITGGADAHKWH